jgi:hypothetical protein
MPAFGYPALNRADTVIAMRTAWERTHERMRGLRRPDWAFEFRHQLRLAYDAIRKAKARVIWDAREAADRRAAEAARAARKAAADAHVRAHRVWDGPKELLDARGAAELEVLRWEMADSFTAEGNSRLFKAKAQLAAIEAQLTWRTVA